MGTWLLKVSCTTSSNASILNRKCLFHRYADAKSLTTIFWKYSIAGHISHHEPRLDRSIQPTGSEHNCQRRCSLCWQVPWYQVERFYGASHDTYRVRTIDTIWVNYYWPVAGIIKVPSKCWNCRGLWTICCSSLFDYEQPKYFLSCTIKVASLRCSNFVYTSPKMFWYLLERHES